MSQHSFLKIFLYVLFSLSATGCAVPFPREIVWWRGREENAATKIQAIVRGVKAREGLEASREAATKTQILKGMVMRRGEIYR